MLSARRHPGLDRLAWIATVDRRTEDVQVLHGDKVETGDNFAVEGVWDQPYELGAFHMARHFFGSGIVRDERGWWLVPSRALVDRLVYCETATEVIASNSLPLLMAWTGARLDPRWNYRNESFAILKGIDAYDSTFHLSDNQKRSFRQAYYYPILIGESGVERQAAHPPQRFSTFSEYVTAVSDVLKRLRDNYTSPSRMHTFDAYSTISTGYDSTATTALVRDFEIEAAFTSRRSNSSIRPWISKQAAIDDGTPIARQLSIGVQYLDDHKSDLTDELYFLAPTAADAELVFAPMAEHILRASRPAVLFSGFHGDKVWDRATSGRYLAPSLLRGDTSGLNLGEIRLKAGFINVPVPFLFADSVADIVAISRSAEMQHWSVGGTYDRPIPRRILEEQGVPRSAFGMRKKAVVQSYNYPVNKDLRDEFFKWLQERHGRGRMQTYLLERTNQALFLVLRVLERGATALRFQVRPAPRNLLGDTIDLPYELHIWALDALTARMSERLSIQR